MNGVSSVGNMARGVIAAGLLAASTPATVGEHRSLVLQQQAAVSRLAPIDEAAGYADLANTRRTVIAMAQRRDDAAIRSFMIPSLSARVPVPMDFAALSGALSLGGSFTTTRGAVSGRREFCAPYTYSAFPRLSALAPHLGGEGDHWVILKADVPVRERPAISAEIKTHLSFDIVRLTNGEIVPGQDGQKWAVVALREGGHGFVQASVVRNSFGWVVCWGHMSGAWQITRFDKAYP